MLTRLPHRVQVQKLERESFGGGTYRENWVTTKTIWANVQTEGNNSDNNYDFEKKQEIRKATVVVRSRHLLTNSNRLLFNGRVFIIINVADLMNRGRYLLVECVEEVQDFAFDQTYGDAKYGAMIYG